MRKAALASIGIHFGLIAGAFVFLNLQPAVDETAAESVSVDIISMDMVSTDPSEEVTEATETLVSAGAEVEAEEVPETAEAEAEPIEVAEAEPATAVQDVVEPVPVAQIEPSESEEVASAEVLSAVPDLIAPVEAAMPQMVDASAALVVDSVQPSQSDPLEAVRSATIGELRPEPPIQQIPSALMKPAEVIKPLETASVAPLVEEELQVAPIPKPRIVRKPVEAKVEPAKEQPKEQPADKPKKAEKQPEKKKPSQQASLGNSGAAEADSAASKKAGGGQGKKNDGGSAAASKYPGLVQSKVLRAARAPKTKDTKGVATVSFVVGAKGNLIKVALLRSSGNPAIDEASLAAVKRAAPFPPIPETAGRSSWTFDIPLGF